MRIEIDGVTFEGPEPTGEAGLKLYQQVWAVLVALGQGDLTRDVTDARRLVALPRVLMASPVFPQLFRSTLAGWSRDGHPYLWESVPTLCAGRLWEPATIVLRVWTEAGFFDVAGITSGDRSPAAEG